MHIKRWMYFSTGASLGMTGPCLAGPDYTLKLYDSWGNGNGGEFRAEWTTANGSPAPRSTGTAFQGIGKGPAPNRFEAFCLEMQEFISLNGSPYSANLNTCSWHVGDLWPDDQAGTAPAARENLRKRAHP